jgi:hypothetical protein
MMILHTKPIEEQKLEVGDYMRQKYDKGKREFNANREVNRVSRAQAWQQYEEKKKSKKPINQQEEAKVLAVNEFDYVAFLDKINIEEGLHSYLLEKQEEDHEKLLSFENQLRMAEQERLLR